MNIYSKNAEMWAETAAMCLDLGYPVEDYETAIKNVRFYIRKAVEIPVYVFERATNLPYPSSKGYFVACSVRDMLPHMCDTVFADNLRDAYSKAFRDAERYGEQYALINGESFEFYYTKTE